MVSTGFFIWDLSPGLADGYFHTRTSRVQSFPLGTLTFSSTLFKKESNQIKLGPTLRASCDPLKKKTLCPNTVTFGGTEGIGELDLSL